MQVVITNKFENSNFGHWILKKKSDDIDELALVYHKD
jgi:hypothetical protein